MTSPEWAGRLPEGPGKHAVIAVRNVAKSLKD